ncbi:hypothetical protein H4R35_002739 [Dimargaris xerosporica]|nr:hypothetical protein H4R35_002739 [Dimargaris xerosporica]
MTILTLYPATQNDHETIKADYDSHGMRRTVEALLITHLHNHPHVLILKTAASTRFQFPGGVLKPGESEQQGLQRILDALFNAEAGAESEEPKSMAWTVGECVSNWWRPNFDANMYPYLPPHIADPKEHRKLYLVPLPEKLEFTVPTGQELIAIPLFDLYQHKTKFGNQIAAVPYYLSGSDFVYND